jgi:hypothetical protein
MSWLWDRLVDGKPLYSMVLGAPEKACGAATEAPQHSTTNLLRRESEVEKAFEYKYGGQPCVTTRNRKSTVYEHTSQYLLKESPQELVRRRTWRLWQSSELPQRLFSSWILV